MSLDEKLAATCWDVIYTKVANRLRPNHHFVTHESILRDSRSNVSVINNTLRNSVIALSFAGC